MNRPKLPTPRGRVKYLYSVQWLRKWDTTRAHFEDAVCFAAFESLREAEAFRNHLATRGREWGEYGVEIIEL